MKPSGILLMFWQENIGIIDNNEMKKMKVDLLKAEVQKCSLSTNGKKAYLLEKLKRL